MEKKRRKSHNSIDMSGKTYNSWKIIEKDVDGSKGKIAYWKAECLNCNKTYSVHGPNIRNGSSRQCLSCGHLEGHDKQKGQVRTKRTPQEAAYHYLFNKLKRDAKRQRGLDWNLSEEYMIKIISSNCEYCGIEPRSRCNPTLHHKLSQKTMDASYITRNGIDRIDSSKGYITGNVAPCCSTCNMAKTDMSLEDFKAWVSRVYHHLNK